LEDTGWFMMIGVEAGSMVRTGRTSSARTIKAWWIALDGLMRVSLQYVRR